MNYLAFANNSLTMIYEAVRRAFSPVDVVREARGWQPKLQPIFRL
jgi:hypothetical protein